MTVAFVHFSDIHFGQEKGGDIYVHDDAKDCLVDDVKTVVSQLAVKRVSGIIVCGDVAYSGLETEYSEATSWLGRVCEAAGCSQTDVLVVPGNHDIDRASIDSGLEGMLYLIAEKGEAQLDQYLSKPIDEQALYRRFDAYCRFALQYGFKLDTKGGNAGERTIEISEGRTLRFIGLNTALACSIRDKAGSLLLGAKQRIMKAKPGEELIVLAHHPLAWLRDGDDTMRFLQSRARIFMSGHEHAPSIEIRNVEDGKDLLLLAAGATVPPKIDNKFTYTYNVIELSWNANTDGLIVRVHPRSWDNDKKAFAYDDQRPGLKEQFELGCPSFKAGPIAVVAPFVSSSAVTAVGVQIPAISEPGSSEIRKDPSMPARFPMLRLNYFKLSTARRLQILLSLHAIPESAHASITSNDESDMLELLKEANRLDELEAAIVAAQQEAK